MLKYALPAVIATALLSSSTLRVLGDEPAAKKPGKSKPNPAKSAGSAGFTGEMEVVGSVNGKQFTWGNVVNELKKNNPTQFSQSVAQAVGLKAAESLFGAAPKPSYTITRAEALASLRKQPTPPIVNELGRMIEEETLNQLTSKMQVHNSEPDLQAALHKLLSGLRAKGNIESGVTDEQFLSSRGVTHSQAMNIMKAQVETGALIKADLEKQLGHPLGPDDYMETRLIFLRFKQSVPDAKPEDKKKEEADTLAKITAVANDIDSKKKTFEASVKDDSEDDSKLKNGDPGPIVRGSMPKEFDETAFALKKDEISKPVHTANGYYLIQAVKTSKELTSADRETAWDNYENSARQNGKLRLIMGVLIAKNIKTTNKLQTSAAMMPGGPPGMRPRVGRPGGPGAPGRPGGPGGPPPGGPPPGPGQ